MFSRTFRAVFLAKNQTLMSARAQADIERADAQEMLSRIRQCQAEFLQTQKLKTF